MFWNSLSLTETALLFNEEGEISFESEEKLLYQAKEKRRESEWLNTSDFFY